MSTPPPAPRYSGADWYEASYKTKLSPLARTVFDVLGQVFAGLYHLTEIDRARIESHYVAVPVYHTELATFDGSDLWFLVGLSQLAHLRFAIRQGTWVYKTNVDDFEDSETIFVDGVDDTPDDFDWAGDGEVEVEVPNPDHEPDDPDNDEPPTRTKTYRIGKQGCLVLWFSQRDPALKCFARRTHASIEEIVARCKRLYEPIRPEAPDWTI